MKRIAIVLGSGLGSLAEGVAVEREISFEEAGLPPSSVPGHAGKFVFGEFEGVPVLWMKGRIHLYEGHPARAVTAGIRWMAEQGSAGVILTNAAGTLNPTFPPGSWMMLSDHINLTSASPLEGPDFVDLTEAYDVAWRDVFEVAAQAEDLTLHEGVYAGLRGPQYETPAEVRMLRAVGADAVGMSCVLETIQARALGLPVAAFSCLTNWAAGILPAHLDHEEVLETGRRSADAMIRLLKRALPQISSAAMGSTNARP